MTAEFKRSKRKLHPVVAILPALLPMALTAQTTVHGVVRSQSLAPIPGATVTVPQLNRTAITNNLGYYELRLEAGTNSSLSVRVASLGYRRAEQTVALSGARVRLDVTLQEQAIPLEGIVVTGTAGLHERRAQPTVISTIPAREITELALINTVADLLQGRVPSLSVTPTSGSSGGAQIIRLRGPGSLNLSNEPLVYIDGVLADSRLQRNNTNGGQVYSRLFDLNPEEIERIEVVKGPAAATLYGASASGGVIQILTRRGIGATRFSQSITAEVQHITPNFTPPANFARCGAQHVAATSSSTLCRGQAVGTIVSDQPLLRRNVLRDGGMRSLSWTGTGGGSAYGYFFALDTEDEEGTLPQNGFERRAARLNFNVLPSGRFALDAGLGLARTVTDLPQNGDNPAGYLPGATLGSPLTVGTPQDGWLQPAFTPEYIATIEQTNRVVRVTPTLQARYQPTGWWTNRLIVGADVTHSEGTYFVPRSDFDAGSTYQDRANQEIYTIDFLGNARAQLAARLVGDFSFGLQYHSTKFDNIIAVGTGLIVNSARSVSSASSRVSVQNTSNARSIGWLGQVQLAYDDRLFVQAGGRIDRNSSWGEATDPFFLPRLGLAYVLSAPVPAKLRVAFGTTGRSPNPASALKTYRAAPYVTNSGQVVQGVYPGSFGNSNLKPERGTELEAGIDAALLDERVGLEATVFRKVTRDLLLPRPLPPSYGFSGDPWSNLGEVRNSGVEGRVNANLLNTRRATLDLRAGFSTLENVVTSLGGLPPAGDVREGRPLGSLWSHRILRVDEARGVAIVTDTAEFIGQGSPSFEGFGGATLTLLQRVRVHTQLDWKRGHSLMKGWDDIRERRFTLSERRVKSDQLPARERHALFGPYETANGQQIGLDQVSEPIVQSASFVRLREVAVNYALPARLAGRLGASAASITVAGRNLALWTGYAYDPEVVTYPAETGEFGFWPIDVFTMPQPHRWSARLNLQF